MEGTNQVWLLGRLGADPVCGETGKGVAYARFRMATNSSYRDRESNDRVVRTEWHNVVAFRGLAKVVGEYLRKGSPVGIVGSLHTRQWEKDGMEQWTTEVIPSDVQLLPDPKRQLPEGSAAGGARAPEPPDVSDDVPF